MVRFQSNKFFLMGLESWRHFTKILPATSFNTNTKIFEMGSKKLKRKKFKCKKLERVCKLKSSREKRGISSGVCKETESEEQLQERKLADNLEKCKNCSRSYAEEEKSDVKYFAKIREGYFRYLQTVVSDNCVFCDALVTEEILENLALYLEQDALLACLQVDIYKQTMMRIIRDIKRCTEEKEVHEEVRKLLPDISEQQTEPINSPKSAADSQVVESYNKIPTMASIRSDDNEIDNQCFWVGQLNCEPYYSIGEQKYQEEYSENQRDIQISGNSLPWNSEETYSSNYWVDDVQQIKENDLKNSEGVFSSQFSNVENDLNCLSPKYSTPVNDTYQSDEIQENPETVDPLLKSRNQLQKSVEQTLNETEKVYRQKRDEQERAYIAQILEGDDNLDERFNDSLSDNENESKENIDESNLVDRLEKMRELFGVGDEESQTITLTEKQRESNKIKIFNNRNRRPTIWRYEKFIQLHKYSIIATEMSFERRQINRKLFLELFGEDSDEEHEAEYSSTEKYRSSCTERISSWVVKYLMPFYHDKRILGRKMFKSLGHYISEAIVDKMHYPDEWAVKYFVSKFFPPRKKYICDADILNFKLD